MATGSLGESEEPARTGGRNDPGSKNLASWGDESLRKDQLAQEKLNLAAEIIDSIDEAIVITDVQGNIVQVNDAFCRLTGYSAAEVHGKNPRVMKSHRHDGEFYRRMWKSLTKTGRWQGELWDRRKDGEVFAKLMSISSITNHRGEVTHFVGVFSDITERKEAEAHLTNLAHYDPLTGLPNRTLAMDRLRQAVLQAERPGRSVAVLVLDLDGFKEINDTLGHPAGDDLLAAVAQRLRETVRRGDTVARIGGDVFTVILPEVQDGTEVASVARKLIDRLAGSYRVADTDISITASIGVAVYPDDGSDAETLIQNADAAMHRAKEGDRNTFQFVSSGMNLNVLNRLELETELRLAIQRDQFVLHYQPQLEVRTGRVVGIEALLRWNHPRDGLVLPGRFVPLAEKTGLIGPIGDWALRAACIQNGAWQREGLGKYRIAVNLSARQAEGPRILAVLDKILKETGLDPNSLELEVGEGTVIQGTESTIEALRQLRRIGVIVSVDRYGAGYASLSHLQRFPVDKVKIDRAIIAAVSGEPDDAVMVRAIIAAAHSMNLKVVAEGVETEAQLAFLRHHDCDFWQGNLGSRPVPADALASFLRQLAG
ncbi:MAG: EAL domain-containing protein [Desulfomonile tiedjei]|nr:EAL domain-containing protein [Desulfomonile tiedjei]